MNMIKKTLTQLLIICLCFSILPSTIMAETRDSEEVEIDTGIVTFEEDETIEDCFPEEHEILGVDLSGELEFEGDVPEEDLDGGEIDIDSLIEDSTEENSGIQDVMISDDFVAVDSLEEDLDGGIEEDIAPSITNESGNEETLQEVSIDELINTNEDEELDGASSSTKGYKLTVSSSKVVKGTTIKVSWQFKNGANHGKLYAILNGKAYPVNVSGNGAKNLKLPSSGKWRICMIAYNKNNKCVYNGYNNSGGSLYVNVGTAPTGYGMSYSVKNKTEYVFKVSVSNTSSYDVVVLKDGAEYARKNFSGNKKSFGLHPTKAGYYQVYLILYNGYGTYNGKSHNRILSFECKAPGFYKWSVSSKNIKLGETVSFTISNLANATSADIVILRNNKVVVKKRFNGTKTLYYRPQDAGRYYAYLITYNEYGRYYGVPLSAVTFKVDGSPEPYRLSVAGNYFSPNQNISISIDKRNADYYYVYIQKMNSTGNTGDSSYVNYFCKKFTQSQNAVVRIPDPGNYRIYLNTYNEYGKFKGYSNGYIATFAIIDNNYFQIGTNNYSFVNTFDSFGYGYYKDKNGNIVSTDKIALQSYKDVFGNTSGWMKWKLDDTWGGSCFGFATSSALSYSGYIDKFGKSALWNVSAPGNKDHDVTHRIERYQLSQNLKAVEKATKKSKNKFSDFVSEVENFEKYGGIPVIACVSGNGGGHAVVARSVFRDSEGRYIVNVCDNNYPSNKNMHIIINANMNGFVYKSGTHTYNENLTFCRANVMYDAMPSKARLLTTLDGNADETNNMLRIYTNADVYTIKNSSGVDMLTSDECIVANKYDVESDYTEYLLPKSTYIIEFDNYSEKKVYCSVSDDSDALITSGLAESGTFYVGIEDYSGKVRSIMDITSTENASKDISVEYLNSVGEIQKFDINGRYLGASINSSGKLEINTDVDVLKQNGIEVDLSSKEPEYDGGDLDGGSGTFTTFSFDNNLNDLDGFVGNETQDYSMCITSNTLNREDGVLNGKLGIAVQNNTGEIVEEKPYIAIYENGKLISINTQTVALGSNTSYFEVNVNDIEILSNDEITIKVFMWNDNMAPKSNAVSYSL